MCALSAPCPYIKYWPEDGSLEPKRVASCVFMTTYVLCLTEKFTLLYRIPMRWLLSKLKKLQSLEIQRTNFLLFISG